MPTIKWNRNEIPGSHDTFRFEEDGFRAACGEYEPAGKAWWTVNDLRHSSDQLFGDAVDMKTARWNAQLALDDLVRERGGQ